MSYTDAEDYNRGQDIGGQTAMVIGGAEMGIGMAMVEGGVTTDTGAGVATLVTGGVGSPVTAPAATGLAVAGTGVLPGAHGANTMTHGANNLKNEKGRVEENVTTSSSKKNPYIGKSKDDLTKSKKRYENLIDEHKQKLQDFKKDPIGNSSPSKLKEMTRDNPSQEVLLERAKCRVDALEKQLKKQQGILDKINEALSNN